MVRNADHIPLEVIYQILDNLDQQADLYQCSLVNKSFNAAINPQLWQQPMILNHDGQHITSISTSLLNTLRQSQKHSLHNIPLGHFIRKLEFGKGNWIPDILKLLPLTPLVEDLAFIGQVMTQKTMKSIAQYCSHLKRLCLSDIPQIPTHLLAPIGQYCHQLCELEIKTCNKLSPTLLMDLTQCPLERLYLCGITIANNHGMVSAIHQLTCLVDLTLTHCSFGPTLIQSISNNTINNNNNNTPILPRLTRLEIGGPHLIPPDELTRFIRSHPHLTQLCLSECIISADTLIAIADSKIHQLCLRENMDLAPFTKKVSYPLVESLVLYRKIDESVLWTLACCFPHLKYLALDINDFPDLECEDSDEDDHWMPTSLALTQLVKDCHQLNRIDFSHVFKSRTLGWQLIPSQQLGPTDLNYIRQRAV